MDTYRPYTQKKLFEAYILGITFGMFGAHHFYLGRRSFGTLYACTLGLFGLGYLFDLVRMRWLVRHVNRYGTDKKMVTDGYLLCAVGGLFGAHLFYLGKNKLGILYAFSLGLFGVGWVVDIFRMNGLVQEANGVTDDGGQDKITAHILCISPLGLIGFHHFYLERWLNGTQSVGFIIILNVYFRVHASLAAYDDASFEMWYFAFYGIIGVWWIFDILRLPVLYERYVDKDEHKYLDEAYLFWFPSGLLGFHQFYLRRNHWGTLYVCTLGCLGVGWLIDGFMLPRMVRDYNKNSTDSDVHKFRICGLSCSSCSSEVPNDCSRESSASGSPSISTLQSENAIQEVRHDERRGNRWRERTAAYVAASDTSSIPRSHVATVQEVYRMGQQAGHDTPVHDHQGHAVDIGSDDYEASRYNRFTLY